MVRAVNLGEPSTPACWALLWCGWCIRASEPLGMAQDSQERPSVAVARVRPLLFTGQECGGLCPQCEEAASLPEWPAGVTGGSPGPAALTLLSGKSSSVLAPHRHKPCVPYFPVPFMRELASNWAQLEFAGLIWW